MKTLEEGVNKRILQLMETLHYSRKDFAKCLGYKNPQNFTRLFRPSDPVRPSFPLIQKLCQITNVDANWLIMGYGSMFIPSSDVPDQEEQAGDEPLAATPTLPYKLEENNRQSSIQEGDCVYGQENGHQIVEVLCHHAQQIGELQARLEHLQQAFDQLQKKKK